MWRADPKVYVNGSASLSFFGILLQKLKIWVFNNIKIIYLIFKYLLKKQPNHNKIFYKSLYNKIYTYDH